jgi:hypothetical protein
LNSYNEPYEEDWKNLVDPKAETFYNEEEYKLYLPYYQEKGLELDKDRFIKSVKNLKPVVLQWLEENVADRKGFDCNKGWCIGSTRYRATDASYSMSVFFHRRSDAMKFIKTFSKWKKPVNYCQYFKDIRKTLNLETLKYDS